jgi:hypothetical protein
VLPLFAAAARRKTDRTRYRLRPCVEGLEPRWTPATNYYFKGISGLVTSWTAASNWRLADGSTPTTDPGQSGASNTDIANFDDKAVGSCGVPASTRIDISQLNGTTGFNTHYLFLYAGSILAVDTQAGNLGTWNSLGYIGTNDGSSYSNDSGEFYLGGGTSTTQSTFTLDGWINNAPSGGTSNRGKFVVGPYTTLNISSDATNRVYPNIGASLYVGNNPDLSNNGTKAQVVQKNDVTINNGANISTSPNAQWSFGGFGGTFNLKTQAPDGNGNPAPGTFGNYGQFTESGSQTVNEYLPFYDQ